MFLLLFILDFFPPCTMVLKAQSLMYYSTGFTCYSLLLCRIVITEYVCFVHFTLDPQTREAYLLLCEI